MRKLFVIISCLLLSGVLWWGDSTAQVKLSSKASSANRTYTITNNQDNESIEQSGSTLYVGNPFYKIATFIDGDATPTIANYSSFRTANTNATTINYFDDPPTSTFKQYILIHITDTYTTINNSDTLDCGGADLNPAAGDVLQAYWNGTEWQCSFLFITDDVITTPTGGIRASTFRDVVVKGKAWYDVRAYGAIADDGNTDVATIQAAIDSCESQGGGTVYFPSGVYEIGFNDTIRVGSNTTIKGAGVGATKFNYTKTSGASATGKPAFWTWADSNITFCDFELDGNAVNNGYMGEWDAGILIGTPTETSIRVIVERVYIHDTSGDGIQVRNAEDVVISECTINTPNVNGAAPLVGRNSISAENVDNVKIIGNSLFYGNPAAIDIEPNASEAASNIIVESNYLKGNNSYRGIAFESGASQSVDEILIFNNLIESFDYGFTLINDSTTNYTVLSNNLIKDCKRPIYSATSTCIKILNNTILGATYDGMLFTTNNSDILVVGNTIKGANSNGINFAGTSGNENTNILLKDNYVLNSSQSGANTYTGIICNYTDSINAVGNISFDNQVSATQKRGFEFANCDYVKANFNNSYGNVTSDVPYFYACTKVRYTFNYANNDLMGLYNYDLASFTLQSASDSRWWIATDTTGSNNTLLIGADGTTAPAASAYAITINADKSVELDKTTISNQLVISDSSQVGSGAWIRKQFWSVTGDSLGIVSYNTVSSKLDTAWAVTK